MAVPAIDFRRSPATESATEIERRGPRPVTTGTPAPSRIRLISLDVLRGFAVAGMLAVNNPGLPDHPAFLRHAPWTGFTFADLVFPLFLFCIGIAIPFSSKTTWRQAVRRAVIIFAVGLVLQDVRTHSLQLDTGVLQHIAVSYLIAWFVLQLRVRRQIAVCVLIFAGYWALMTFVASPVAPAGSWAQSGNLNDWLNNLLLRRPANEGILAAVVSAVNVVAGGWAARLFLRPQTARRALVRLVAAAAAATAFGLALAPLMPVNKHFWTPSFALFSIGLSCALLALAYWLVDARGVRKGLGPLRELGANPLAVYFVLSVVEYVRPAVIPLVLGHAVGIVTGDMTGSVVYSLLWVVAGWMLAHALYRRGIFIRI